MPLHDDDPGAEGNLTDAEYEALLADMRARAAAENEPPCRMAVPQTEVWAALERLDAAEDYRG
jgi:hypothetical protein